jgi:APA family basic amino acid/polyamine antiporter
MAKMGFGAVLALVVGSQIGSGVFMSPTSLAPFGTAAFFGWGVAGSGAILLALVFAQLSMRVTRTGGPHAFIELAFGRHAAFFMAWTYWVISWISTPAVLIAASGYLSPLIGSQDPWTLLWIQLGMLLLITLINLRGVQAAGRAEFVLSILKVVPLLVIPALSIGRFDATHLAPIATGDWWHLLPQTVALTFWGFIGIETATATAGSVHNPSRTIPRAVVLGTAAVAVLYLMNSLGIMGLMPFSRLAASPAPYAEAAGLLLGSGWDAALAAVASLVCIGTLNAWVLISGQIASAAAIDGLFPQVFAQQNRKGAPAFGLILSAIGIVPMLLFTLNPSLGAQLNWMIDLSVTAFLLIYAACIFAYFRILQQQRSLTGGRFVLGALALLFCGAVLAWTPVEMVALSLLFAASGLPVYLYQRRRRAFENEGASLRLQPAEVAIDPV